MVDLGWGRRAEFREEGGGVEAPRVWDTERVCELGFWRGER